MLKLRYTRGRIEVVEAPEAETPGTKNLHVLEALYLLYTGKAEILDEKGNKLSFKDLITMLSKETPYAWVLFEVYYDLRRRGKLPTPGPRPHSLLLRRSKRDPRYTHYILVLEESRRVPAEQLLSFIEEAAKNGWEPVLAIVDRYGDITYYTAKRLRPRPIGRENKQWQG